MRYITLALSGAIFVASSAAPGQTPESPAQAVRRAEAAFAATMAARDFAAFAAFIADEAVFLGSRGPSRGKQAVLEGWRAFFDGATPPFTWEPDSVEVLASGSLAWSSGPVRDAAGTRVSTFDTVWRREADGRWRVIFDKGCRVCVCGPGS